MARSGDGEGWTTGRRTAPREPEWLEEHGARFYFDNSGRRHFETLRDAELHFRAEHGNCPVCDGTGFELYERGGYGRARRCERLPPLASRAPREHRGGSWEKAWTKEAE
jgi:hypothetical protein